MKRNEWIQIILTQNEKNFRVFINGIPEFSIEQMNQILNLSFCEPNFFEKNSGNAKNYKNLLF